MAHFPPPGSGLDRLRVEAEFEARKLDHHRHLNQRNHGEPPEDPNRKPNLLRRFWRVLFP